MKTLVIADIHHKHVRAQAIIDSVEHDRVVLTGDYFDGYGDTVAEAQATAIWLKEKVLYNPKITALVGNHDVNYVWQNNPNYRCSGFTVEKAIAINDILTEADKSQLKFFHVEQGFAFTHAGVSNQIWKKLVQRHPENRDKSKLEYFSEVLNAAIAEAITISNRGEGAELFGAGWDRNGWQRDGGITWVDWNHLSPVNGINQIVGHSKHHVPQIFIQKEGGAISKKTIIEHYEHEALVKQLAANTHVWKHVTPVKQKGILSTNYNLDTALGHYAVITDGKVDIYDYINNLNLRDLGNYNIPESPLNSLG